MTQPKAQSPAKTALVLAGGGSLGAVQVGMLRALVERGVKADLIVGSSVGSINGAYFAGDPTQNGVEKLARLWCSLKRSDIFPWTWRRLFGFLRGRGHLVTSDGLRGVLDRHLPYRELQEAAVPLHIVASDMLTGRAVVLSRGSATQAILASTAIPAAFAPVEVDGRMLCDGAIASNTPVTTAIALGARRLIILPTGFACAPDRPPSGAIASALHAITLLTASQLVAEIGRIRKPMQYHILPTACPLGVTPFDFARTPQLIDDAYRKTRGWIADGGLERSVIPDSLRPHLHMGAGAPPRPVTVERDSREPARLRVEMGYAAAG